ncbi:MAG: hypothetical protein ACXQT2_01460 [Methanotrichaceae archaeon]
MCEGETTMSHIPDILSVFRPGEKLTGDEIAIRVQAIDPRSSRAIITGVVNRASLRRGIFEREPLADGSPAFRYWPASKEVLEAQGYVWEARDG